MFGKYGDWEHAVTKHMAVGQVYSRPKAQSFIFIESHRTCYCYHRCDPHPHQSSPDMMGSTAMPTAASAPRSGSNPLSASKRRIAFTTPLTYAGRLSQLLHLHGFLPLSCPTILVGPAPHTTPSLHLLNSCSAIAFTSRNGISALSAALSAVQPPLPETGDTFTIAALGKDAELLDSDFISKLCRNPARITVLVPSVPSPDGMVAALGDGLGRRILCPSPVVVGLEEPPVVPGFLRALASRGWSPVRVPAYETRWAGPACAAALVEGNSVDAVVFTSTAEVEGMLKSLREMGFDWGMVRERRPGMLVAAHGPVTASGAERLGVNVDVVSERFGSFDGVVEALAVKFADSSDDKQR